MTLFAAGSSRKIVAICSLTVRNIYLNVYRNSPYHKVLDARFRSVTTGLKSPQVGVEPADSPLDRVLAMLRLAQPVPLVRIDHELGLNAQSPQRMPEFVRLRGRALAVAIADQNQGRGLHLLDEVDRRTLGVDGRIIVDRRAEERNHPLVDGVLAVIALPVGDTGPRDGGAESPRLCDGPHGHVAAVAPAADAHPLRIYRRSAQHLIDASQDVAQITTAKILDVGLREFLAL